MTRLQARTAPVSPSETQAHSKWLVAVVLLCFLTSGATSLVLEGTLTRLLRFVLGNTTLSITTVLCAFMAGLALGSYIAGRLGDRTSHLLRIYGLLEGAVGLSCLLLPVAIQLLQPVYHAMYLHLQDSPLLLSLARFLSCGLLLLVPSTFMGATLPLLSRWYALRFGAIGKSIAGLYAINSAGAGLGALVCGFVLLPGLGVTGTLRLACGVAMAICLLMLLIDRTTQAQTEPEAAGELTETSARQRPGGPTARSTLAKGKPKSQEALPPGWRTGLLVAYGISGGAAMVYEVGWTRALALVVGSTTYAFSLMLAAFILGLALGSAILVRWIERIQRRLQWFGILELGIGLSAVAALPVFGQMPVWIVNIVREHRESFAMLQAIEFALMFLIMMVPTTLMGAAFPLVSRACATAAGQVGRSVGGVYAANTVGAIVGTFLCSFVLIPQLGMQNAVLTAVACNVLIGAVVLWLLTSSWMRRSLLGAGTVLFSGFVLFGLPSWDPSVMTSGAYLYGNEITKGASDDAASIRERLKSGNGKVIFLKDDICTNVTVRDYPTGVRTLAVGGKIDASTGGDIATQLLLAHAPLLLHPHPRNVCVIGLASGMTAGAAACYDLEQIDCVEISPAVVEASHFFDEYNGHILDDPRVKPILADGRNHLSMTSKQYDVIISEPSNPWIAGVADLFTREFFQICRQRLSPGGLACVWLQAYELDEPLFRSVIHTFHEVFPHVVIYESIPRADYMLIGGAEPIGVACSRLVERIGLPKVAKDLERAGIRQPTDFLRNIITNTGAGDYATGAALHTDDNALLEFAAPRTLRQEHKGMAVAQGLNRYRKADLSFLARLEPADSLAATKLQHDAERLVEAQRLAIDAVARNTRGDFTEAFQLAGQAAQLDPTGPEALNELGKVILADAADYVKRGNAAAAQQLYERAAHMAPRFYEAQEKMGMLCFQLRRWSEAIAAMERAASIAPDNWKPASDVAWLLATCPDAGLRNGPKAAEWAERACRISGNEPFTLRALAAAYAETGRMAEATDLAEKALSLVDTSRQAALAEQLTTQLSLYRQGKPYYLPAGK